MSITAASEGSAPQIKAPVCPTCGTLMRFESGSPDERHPNLRRCIFKCDCGRTSDQLLADLP